MVGAKGAIVIGVILVVAFLFAGGGKITKDAIDKIKPEVQKLREGISERSANIKKKSEGGAGTVG